MTQQDLQILHELQRYAQRYFDAIYKGALTPGEYTAKQLIRDERKMNKSTAGYYVLPENEEFKTDIEITVGSFSCSFPYHSIFEMLARWETIFKPGKKDKAIFAVGGVEITTAPVIYQEKRNGKYVVKKVRLQRVLGNYWRPAKQSSDKTQIELIYELNGVYFIPGCKFAYCLLKGKIDDYITERLEGKNNAWITKQLLAFCEKDDYYKKVVELAGIATTQAENETEEKELPQQESEQAENETEEKEQQEYEKELQARKEKEQAEQARKIQLVDDARKKILSGGELTVEQIELLAESLDYHIHGRTLGMMRERITAMSIDNALSVSLSGYDIKKRNVNAACDVLRELYKLVLSETLPTLEEMSAPKATETAQISTETTETKELSTDKENSVKTTENSQIEQLPGKESENDIGVIADMGANSNIVADKIGVSERIEPDIGAELNSRHCPQIGIIPTDTGAARAIYVGALSPPEATKLASTTILQQPYPNIEINAINSV